MKHRKLAEALNEIRDSYIQEALHTPRKKRAISWLSGVAAVLAVILCVTTLFPGTVRAEAVCVAEYPETDRGHAENVQEQLASLQDFFTNSMTHSLAGHGNENMAYSPINLYMSLALTAELTAGNSQKQILDALHASSPEVLQAQTTNLWNACYLDTKSKTLLANSLWLDESLAYQESVMQVLKYRYYTSVYRGDLGSDRINWAITDWLNLQTGKLLKEEASKIALPQDTVLALYSTVYYQAKWTQGNGFFPSRNTKGPFHSPTGDRTVTYMNKEKLQTYYYWAEDFGAIALSLRDGSRMWLILPDPDKTVADVLAAEEYATLLLTGTSENNKYVKANITIPKFDIRAQTGLSDVFHELGITDVLDPLVADFSRSVSGSPVWLTGANQATRVAIDEEGVTAASYIEIPGAGAAMPPDEIIDFIVDRPFLFAITNHHNIPLFAGIVNEP